MDIRRVERVVREASSLTANHCHSPPAEKTKTGKGGRGGKKEGEKRKKASLKGDSNYLFTKCKESTPRRFPFPSFFLPFLLFILAIATVLPGNENNYYIPNTFKNDIFNVITFQIRSLFRKQILNLKGNTIRVPSEIDLIIRDSS